MEGKLHLKVNESVPPVIMLPHRVPVALEENLKEEIDRLVSVGVSEKVEELSGCPVQWSQQNRMGKSVFAPTPDP